MDTKKTGAGQNKADKVRIEQFAVKLDFLAHDKRAKQIGGHSSRAALGRLIGVSPNTFNGWFKPHLNKKQEINSAWNRNIAARFHFDLNHPAWLTASLEDFIVFWRKHSEAVPGNPMGHIDPVDSAPSRAAKQKALIIRRLQDKIIEQELKLDFSSGEVTLARHPSRQVDDAARSTSTPTDSTSPYGILADIRLIIPEFSPSDDQVTIEVELVLGSFRGCSITRCRLVASLGDGCQARRAHERRRLPGPPTARVMPEGVADRHEMRLEPDTISQVKLGWYIEIKRPPINAFTIANLIELASFVFGAEVSIEILVSRRGLVMQSGRA